jgi:hypothetical protein
MTLAALRSKRYTACAAVDDGAQLRLDIRLKMQDNRNNGSNEDENSGVNPLRPVIRCRGQDPVGEASEEITRYDCYESIQQRVI